MATPKLCLGALASWTLQGGALQHVITCACGASAALPTLDIAEGALDRVFEIYKRLLPQLGGYLTHAGRLHQGRLERVLAELGALELETLQQRAEVRAG